MGSDENLSEKTSDTLAELSPILLSKIRFLSVMTVKCLLFVQKRMFFISFTAKITVISLNAFSL